MILRKSGRIGKGQQGFTLIETLVALVIVGLIGAGSAMATVQVFTQSARNNDYTTASRHTMNAIYWIGRDGQMSQVVERGEAAGFPLTLSWTEWDNSEHQVIYSIEADKLRRSYSINGGEPSQMLVAQYINAESENTTCDFDGGVLTVKVTAAVGTGTHTTNVTKEREITPRPGL